MDRNELERDQNKVAVDLHLVVKPGPSSFPLGCIPGQLNSVAHIDWATPGTASQGRILTPDANFSIEGVKAVKRQLANGE